MTSKDLNPEEFWQYSLEIYSHDKVKDIFLQLQDGFCADINLLLLLLWLDNLGVTIDTHGFGNLLQLSNKWQANVLKPLRQERRAQKKAKHSYKLALQNELDAEKDEQAALVACANRHLVSTSAADKSDTSLLDQYAAAQQLPQQALLGLQAFVQELP